MIVVGLGFFLLCLKKPQPPKNFLVSWEALQFPAASEVKREEDRRDVIWKGM